MERTMKSSRHHMVDLIGVVSLLFALVIMFPSLITWARDFPLPLRILVDLSPYIVSIGAIAGLCAIRRVPLARGFGFSADDLGRQATIALVIFAVTISFVVVPVLIGIDAVGEPETRTFQFIYQIVKAMTFVGLGEELIWRGYVLAKASLAFDSAPADIIVSSMLFGLWHYPVGQDLFQVVGTALLGLLYALARYRLKQCSTLATGIAHGLHNTVILVIARLLA